MSTSGAHHKQQSRPKLARSLLRRREPTDHVALALQFLHRRHLADRSTDKHIRAQWCCTSPTDVQRSDPSISDPLKGDKQFVCQPSAGLSLDNVVSNT